MLLFYYLDDADDPFAFILTREEVLFEKAGEVAVLVEEITVRAGLADATVVHYIDEIEAWQPVHTVSDL